jgi:hypothetical protein
LVLWCMDIVDKKFREKERGDTSEGEIAYHRFMANNGVQPLIVRESQAEYLDTFSHDSRLFYLAFAFVDGTDGIANGIARIILSYLGDTLEEGDNKRMEIALEEGERFRAQQKEARREQAELFEERRLICQKMRESDAKFKRETSSEN